MALMFGIGSIARPKVKSSLPSSEGFVNHSTGTHTCESLMEHIRFNTVDKKRSAI